MPGIFGCFSKDHDEGGAQLCERMAEAMNGSGEMLVDRHTDRCPGLGWGRVSLGILNRVKQPIESADDLCGIVFHGELYNGNLNGSEPEYVLRQYREAGDRCAKELTGIFHFAVVDRKKGEIKLFSDKFGLQPLYYALLPEGIIFAGEVKALLCQEGLLREPDHRSLADFLHYGQILGNKTLFKEVKLLPPGSVLTFRMEDGRAELKSYFELDSVFSKNGNDNAGAGVEAAVALLVDSIRRRAGGKEALGLSLSGGLDSRGILAGLGEEAQGLATYTLGLPGCADQGLAERMSQAAGTRHEFVELDQLYLADFEGMASGMIRLSDGMYHPHESTEMLALEYFKRAPFKILLRGHGGEVAKAALAYPVMALPEVYQCRGGTEVLDYIFRITNLVVRDVDIGRLFRPPFREVMQSAPMESLKESCAAASESLAPADVCLFYYINEHIRRQVVASLEIFRSRIEIRLPYVDAAFFKSLLSLPVELRKQGEIHHALIRRCMPALMRIPNSNTGAPLDAGPLRLFLTDKLTSLMKRLSVRGFRHYTEFQRWHREGFREHTRKIVFDERTAGRGIYDMDHLKTVFDLHAEGKKDYGHLLGTIVGLELWFREFVDKPPDSHGRF